MRKNMRSKILGLTIGIIILICLAIAGGLSCLNLHEQTQEETQKEELKLSDFPDVFKNDTLIVIGENASQIEKESAEAIAAKLENLTGNTAIIINDTALTEDNKSSYNLILVGTPKSNSLLQEVYNLTNATKVTEEYPGKNKGILEILRNPWNEDKAMLLVEGSDEWGVKAGSVVLTKDETIDEFHGEMIVTSSFIRIAGRIRVIGNEPFTQVVLETSEEVYELTGDKAKKHGLLWKLQGETVEIQGFLQGRTPPSFRTEKSIDVIKFKETKNLGGDKK